MNPEQSLSDREVLALTLWGEARGEPVEGRIAVGCCVRNRVNTDIGGDGKPDWWGEGYKGVCLAPMQFSCWNASDPNRQKLLALIPTLTTPLDSVLRECLWISGGIMGGALLPRIGTATHYYDERIAAPSWTKGASLVAQIGHHRFYMNVK